MDSKQLIFSDTIRILLAEDNITNQQVALGMLKKLNLHADAVANGAEAIKSLELIDYDLVLMDVQMPEMDGLEATRNIRNSHYTVRKPKIPIIAMTAHAMQGDRELCLKAGMDDYISKPITIKALAEKLEQWLLTIQQKQVSADVISKQEDPKIPVPVYDRDGFLERLMGDEGIAQKVVEVFLEDIPKQIESLKISLETGDIHDVQRIAHGIKGAAANIGGEVLRELAAEIEAACHAKNEEFVQANWPKLQVRFEQLKEVIQNTRP